MHGTVPHATLSELQCPNCRVLALFAAPDRMVS